MFWNKKKTVRVVFVDADTGASVAQTDSPPEQLPESFEAHTTVNVQGQEWEILSAVPVTRAEFVASGELRLNVRKVSLQKMPPGELLYSLPTICDGIPGIAAGTSKLSKRVLELHEDDWRQIELVSAAYSDEVRACLAKIDRIYEKERTPGGAFNKVYVREELAAPIAAGALTPAALMSYFPSGVTSYDGLAYRGVAGLIGAGFAFGTAASLVLYGVAPAGLVTTVGLVLDGVASDLEADARSLANVLRANELTLVDWCRVQVVDGQGDHVLDYLRSRMNRKGPTAAPTL
jgi:hypothetical protein